MGAVERHRGVGEHVPASFDGAAHLDADETYRAFRNGASIPLPSELAGVSPQRVVDVQEDRMWLAEPQGGDIAAEIVFDAQSANVLPKRTQWPTICR